MTNPTDPRVEAATLALLETDNYDLSLSDTSLEAHLKEPHSGDCTREIHSCLRCICAQAQKEAILILKAADAAAWQPIESAPKNEKVLLGWYKPDGKWCMSFDMAVYDWKCGDYASGEGKHSKATHWQTFPVGP